MSDSLGPQGLQQARLPCPSLSPTVCSNSCPLSWSSNYAPIKNKFKKILKDIKKGQCSRRIESERCSVVSNSLQFHGLYRILQARIFLLHRIFSNQGIEPKSSTLQADFLPAEPQGKAMDTGVGSLSLLQGIFPTQGSNPGLPHCRQIFYQLSHKGSPRILEWVVYPFSRGSFQLTNRTWVSCIAGAFFTS